MDVFNFRLFLPFMRKVKKYCDKNYNSYSNIISTDNSTKHIHR